MNPASDITDQVNRLADRGESSVAAVMPIVYDELRRLAEVHLQRERPDHTLQATALVNEAYLKLVDQTRASFNSRDHFFAVAAQAIRRILVDHARGKKRLKRGGGKAAASLTTSILADSERNIDLLDLEEALIRLTEQEPEKARVVEMRYFGEMTEEQIARVLGITERTVRRYWEYARAWLYRELNRGEEG